MFRRLLGILRKQKPEDPLFLRKGEFLLQMDGRVYKLSGDIGSPQKFRDNLDITKRTIQLAEEYGASFYGFNDGIHCTECSYTGIFMEAMQCESVISKGSSSCLYTGRKDTSIICVFTNRKRKIAFMAKERPCAVIDAYLRALVEQGHLDRYLLRGIEPKNFHSIADFEPGSELERKACEEYQAMKL